MGKRITDGLVKQLIKKLTVWTMPLLAGCSILTPAYVPPPAPTGFAQEIEYNQTRNLYRLKSVSVRVKGDRADSEAAVKAEAKAVHADYYMLVFNRPQRLHRDVTRWTRESKRPPFFLISDDYDWPPYRWHAYVVLYCLSEPVASASSARQKVCPTK